MKNYLFIANGIDKTDILITSINENTIYKIGNDVNLDQIQECDNIGFLYHSNYFFPFYEQENNKRNVKNGDYFGNITPSLWEKIKSLNCNVDLITCNIKEDYIVSRINNLFNQYGICIRYSLDETGNYNKGGDWILENSTCIEKNVDIKNIYFNDNIENWDVVLTISPLPTGYTDLTNSIANKDDGWWEINSPFPIIYNKISYNKFYVGTNSYITFQSGSTKFYETDILSIPQPRILLAACDMIAYSFGMKIDGNNGSRVLSLRYYGTIIGFSSNNALSWEVKFYETNQSVDNKIEIVFLIKQQTEGSSYYHPVSGCYGDGTTNKLFDINTQENIVTTIYPNSASAGGDPYITTLHQEFYKLPGKIRNYRLFQSENCVINASVSPIKTRDAENLLRAFKDVDGFIPKTDGFYFDAYHIQIGDEFLTFDERIELINKSNNLELLHIKKHEELITNNINGMSSTYFLTEVLIVDSSCNNILVELKRDLNPQIVNGISIRVGDVNSIKNTTGALVRRSNPRNYEIKSLNNLKLINETKYTTSKNYHVKKETFYSKQVVGLRMN